MEINKERLLADLNELRKITDTPGNGVTRFSYGEKDAEARKYIINRAKTWGLGVRVDAVGNMYIGNDYSFDSLNDGLSATPENSHKRIVIGSHIDTVRNGGWLDGVYGVVGGLEILRTLSENDCLRKGENINPDGKNVELVIFAEEEGSNFGSCMTGSKFVTGIYSENDLKTLKNDSGTDMEEMLRISGFPPYKKNEIMWDFNNIKAMLELHIEQGPVLDRENVSIGIVDWANGMSVSEFTIEGVGNHAGGTPMAYRHDALVTASYCITEAEKIAKNDPQNITVATIGKLNVFPNCSNVIPEKVTFTLEVRDKNVNKIHKTMDEITERIFIICKERDLKCETKAVAYSMPIRFDENIREVIEDQTRKLGYSHRAINSGAVHDACMIAAHAPAAMVFVPSKDGRSHVPFEDTNEGDLAKGVQVLLDTVLTL